MSLKTFINEFLTTIGMFRGHSQFQNNTTKMCVKFGCYSWLSVNYQYEYCTVLYFTVKTTVIQKQQWHCIAAVMCKCTVLPSVSAAEHPLSVVTLTGSAPVDQHFPMSPSNAETITNILPVCYQLNHVNSRHNNFKKPSNEVLFNA